MNGKSKNSASAAGRLIVWVVFALVCLSVVGAAFGLATDIFLILFLAILFGVFLSRTSQLLDKRTPLSYSVSLAIVTMILLLVLIGGIAMFGGQFDKHIAAAREHADAGVEKVRDLANSYSSFRSVLQSTPFLRKVLEDDGRTSDRDDSIHSSSEDSDRDEESSSDTNLAEQSAIRSTVEKGALALVGIFRTTFGLLINSVLIFFVGLFLAVAPREYRDGVVQLVPPRRRERTREILNLVGETLWRWIIGQMATMVITGAGAWLLLLALGVPLALTLGVITALLSFVPNIGAFVSLVLAILFAAPEGGDTVALVVVGYIALQMFESYVITPLIQEQQVSVPPALLISFQAVMGVLFGFLGAAVAAPLLAASKVIVEEAYVKDMLERPRDDSAAGADVLPTLHANEEVAVAKRDEAVRAPFKARD